MSIRNLNYSLLIAAFTLLGPAVAANAAPKSHKKAPSKIAKPTHKSIIVIENRPIVVAAVSPAAPGSTQGIIIINGRPGRISAAALKAGLSEGSIIIINGKPTYQGKVATRTTKIVQGKPVLADGLGSDAATVMVDGKAATIAKADLTTGLQTKAIIIIGSKPTYVGKAAETAIIVIGSKPVDASFLAGGNRKRRRARRGSETAARGIIIIEGRRALIDNAALAQGLEEGSIVTVGGRSTYQGPSTTRGTIVIDGMPTAVAL